MDSVSKDYAVVCKGMSRVCASIAEVPRGYRGGTAGVPRRYRGGHALVCDDSADTPIMSVDDRSVIIIEKKI